MDRGDRSPPRELERAVEEMYDLSLEVTQWRTRTEKRISALQHMRQSQAASPLRTIRTVRLLFGISKGRLHHRSSNVHNAGCESS